MQLARGKTRVKALVQNNILVSLVVVLGVVCFAVFSWAEYGYFCDQAASHHETCSGFWSNEHLHDWIYNTTSNWQSELLFGVLLVTMLRKIGRAHNDPEAKDI